MNSSESFASPPFDSRNLGELFSIHRERLRRMVTLRLDRRLNGRVDASDVMQDVYLEAARRFDDYVDEQAVSPYIWLRFLTGQRIAQLHRFHLGAQARDAGKEISINDAGGGPEASSMVLAAQLVGRFSSPSNALNRAEQRQQIETTLNNMDPLDREVLALRHFEQLDNAECAEVLQIDKQAAYKRYFRAIRRLKQKLDAHDFNETP